MNVRNLKNIGHFVRHIPPKQLFRRVYLRAKQKVTDRIVATSPLTLEPLVYDTATLPLPGLYAPSGNIEKNRTGWSATFLSKNIIFRNSIDWTNPDTDAATQLWRMNLHYFEFLSQVSNKIGIELIKDWIENCRPNCASSTNASWNSYAISLRLSAWIDFSNRSEDCMIQEFNLTFQSSIIEQANYLCANIESDILGNHVVKNIRTLYECSAYFVNQKITKHWLKTAEYWLRDQVPYQILTDGVHFERSVSYHMQVFADLLTIYPIVQNRSTKQIIEKCLRKMALSAVDLCHPDQQVAQFNDSGLTMTVAPQSCLAIYENLLSEKAPSAQARFSYPFGGFYGCRDSKNYVVFKMGQLGPDELMAHAHCDWGAFEWSYKGKRLFVDQGVFEYIQGAKRKLSRSASSHNTATVHSREQANFIGSFRCANRPRPSRACFSKTSSGFELSGEMKYEDGGSDLVICRHVNFSDCHMSIKDSASGQDSIKSSFLLHPDHSLQIVSNRHLQILPEHGGSIAMMVSDQSQFIVEDAVWWPDMGVEFKTRRILASSEHGSQTITFTY